MRKEEELEEAEHSQRMVMEELRKTREELCAEREKWEVERESYKQVNDTLHVVYASPLVCTSFRLPRPSELGFGS